LLLSKEGQAPEKVSLSHVPVGVQSTPLVTVTVKKTVMVVKKARVRIGEYLI
jgi:hypothetical protein